MKTIHSERLPRVLKNKKLLEKRLNVKITNKGRNTLIEGKGVDEYYAEKVIDALNFGFPLKVVMLIKEEDFIFEAICIKDYTKKHDLKRIRARIIGRGGKTLKTLCHLTKCFFEIKNNEVGIIGDAEDIKNAQQSIISLIQGSKHANVYKYLEKHQQHPIIDLGLKEENKQLKDKL